MRELEEPRNKNGPPFSGTMSNSNSKSLQMGLDVFYQKKKPGYL